MFVFNPFYLYRFTGVVVVKGGTGCVTEGLASSQVDPPSNSRQLRVLGASKDLGKHDLVQTYASLVSLDFVYGFKRGAIASPMPLPLPLQVR